MSTPSTGINTPVKGIATLETLENGVAVGRTFETTMKSENTLQDAKSVNSAKAKPVGQLRALDLDPRSEQGRVPLTVSGGSFLEIGFLPDDLSQLAAETFDVMWGLHPAERGRVIMPPVEVKSHRWHKAYLNTPKWDPNVSSSYMYSGRARQDNVNDPLPAPFQPFLDHFNAKQAAAGGHPYNQVVANWYGDGDDYIAYHSDCERGMVPNATITTVTLYKPAMRVETKDATTSGEAGKAKPAAEEGLRLFSLKPKIHCTDSLFDEFMIKLPHGCVVAMCGKTQKEFRHSVPPSPPDAIVGPRISLTFRQFATPMCTTA